MTGTGLWIGLGALYVILIFTLAVLCFRKGHWVFGVVGFVFPLLWVIGAMLPDRSRYR